jgi:4-hydroxy-tetrahydrodipicolinate reductase
MIKVGVFGAGGRMGSMVCRTVVDDPELELVAAVDPQQAGIDLRQLGVPGTGLNVSPNSDALLQAGAEVAVDFTIIDGARENLAWCADNGVHAVVGTSGFEAAEVERFRQRFEKAESNAVVVPNFAISAVLMMRFAELASPFFDTAEIIELHHDEKVDAPSGTAIATAERMADASSDWAPDPTTKTVLQGARGGEGAAGIPIHSVRLRGLMAHQEVLLGTTGQSLTIRQDSYDRTSFMPGVLLAIKAIPTTPGLTFGLDALLGI